MAISETATLAAEKARWRMPSISLSAQTRTVILFACSATIGGAGWSGNPALNYLALLFPFVYLQSRSRLDSLCAVFYYAAATWNVIPGSQSFFQTGHNFALPLAIWAALVAFCSAPWVCFFSRRYVPLSAIVAGASYHIDSGVQAIRHRHDTCRSHSGIHLNSCSIPSPASRSAHPRRKHPLRRAVASRRY